MKKSISELRQDAVSGDWVVIATGRAKRPHDFLQEKRPTFRTPKESCPFEALHPDALIVFSRGQKREKAQWWVEAISNKYPAFAPLEKSLTGLGKRGCASFYAAGPYRWTEGIGFHEVVVTRDHTRSIAEMSDEEVEMVIRAYQERYRALQKEDCIEYIAIFHNHGRLSGATIAHPHSQIMALPVIPPAVGRSLKGSSEYFRSNHSCIHCAVIKHELGAASRIIYENESCVALAPYASKTAFEMRIFPKAHSAHFEKIQDAERAGLAAALRVTLAKLRKGLNNPDYNFFLHTAPAADKKEYDHYHWHIEILPKTAIWAGFEIGTGIEISTISPESAAAFLKSIKEDSPPGNRVSR